MSEIYIIDKTHQRGGAHYALEYTLPGARRSVFNQAFPIAGTVGAAMCDACRRIVLRGFPKDPSSG
jgi:hypothetical protein